MKEGDTMRYTRTGEIVRITSLKETTAHKPWVEVRTQEGKLGVVLIDTLEEVSQ